MMKTEIILLIIAVVILPIYGGYEHTGESYNTPINVFFKFTCNPKQGLYVFNGNDYDHHHKDRTFTLICKTIARKEENHCYWTDILNEIDHTLNFNCPDGQFIGGVLSHHHDRDEDRTWSVRCCKNSEVQLSDCRKSPYSTTWKESFQFEPSSPDRFIAGLQSEHSNGHEDRKWRFYHCHAKIRAQSKVCDSKKAIMRFQGNFNQETLDRQWNFECSSHDIVNDNVNCYWSAMANYLDLPLYYRCKSNFYINAIESYGNNYNNDRVYNLRCCSGLDFKTYGCKLTDDYINNLRGNIDFRTNGKIFLGIESYHDNTQEDRRWKLETCEYGRRIRKMECPSGHGIYKIRSSYNNDMHDRDWTYECRKIVQSFDNCYWTDYIDYTNGYFKTDCQVLNGMESLYNVNLKRRVWKVRCCSSKNLVPAECTKTNDLNGVKGEMNYEVNGNAIVTGLESFHIDDANDAIWKARTCRFIEPNLSFDCGTNYALSYIKSEFFNNYNDRIWTFGCTKVSEAGFENCHWLSKANEPFINKADMPMMAYCHDFHVIVSGKSTYSTLHGDRQWDFQCCKPKGNFIIKKENCVATPYLNSFQEHLEIKLKPNHVITGLESYHENNYEDRRWKASVCEFECCGGK